MISLHLPSGPWEVLLSSDRGYRTAYNHAQGGHMGLKHTPKLPFYITSVFKVKNQVNYRPAGKPTGMVCKSVAPKTFSPLVGTGKGQTDGGYITCS